MTFSLLALAVAPSLAIALFVYAKDKYEKEPLSVVLISFLFGCLSVIPAIALEWTFQAFGFGISTTSIAMTAFFAFVVVGGSEEFSKWLMVRAYPWKNKAFNEPFDGIIYALMVSLGFATVENIMYVAQGGLEVGILRMFTAVPAHASFGIIMGYYLGLAKFDQENKMRLIARGILMAILLHGAYDFFLFQNEYRGLPLTGFWIFSFIGLIIAIRLSFKAMKTHQENSPFKPNDELLDQ